MIGNQQIRRLAERDRGPGLAGRGGLLRQEYSQDGLHLNSAGYKVLAEVYASALGLQPSKPVEGRQ